MIRRSGAAVVAVIVIGAIRTSSPDGAIEHARAAPAQPSRGAQRLLDLFTVDGGPVTPGAPPAGASGIAPSDCAGCHAEIAAEWASSAHARAWTDPIFDDTRVPAPCAGPPVRLDFELDDARATELSWSLELFRLAPADARARGLADAATGLRVQSGRIAIRP